MSRKPFTMYRTSPFFLDDMGSIPAFTVRDKPMETKEQEWLWFVNRMRDYDGLPHLTDVPDGLKFTRVKQP